MKIKLPGAFVFLKKISILLNKREKKNAFLIFFLMLCVALLETLGVASIMPFVAVLSNPDLISNNEIISKVYIALGFLDPTSFMIFLGLCAFFIFLSTLAFKAYTVYAITKFSFNRLHSIATRLLNAYLRQPYEFFLDRNPVDMTKTILSEVGQVTNGLLIPVLKVLSGVLVSIVLFIFLMFIDPYVSASAAIILGGSYYITYLLSRRVLERIGKLRIEANKERFLSANESFSGIKELKLLGREEAYFMRFNDASSSYAYFQATSSVIGSIPQYAIRALSFGGILLMVLYLLLIHENIKNALPFIAVYAFAGYRILPAFQEIFSNVAKIRFTLPILDVLVDDIRTHNIRMEPDELSMSPKLSFNKSLQLHNISYQYPGTSKFALKNIDLNIQAGQCIALVGATGSGKSTLIDIILGLLTPTKGLIRLDSILLEHKNIRSWQDNIGYVPQMSFLADTNVINNIAFGISPDSIDFDKVIAAAKAAQIHDFVTQELTNGYETLIGENGVKLSGGQRQRIAIARALYSNPDVLVMDEATSALDAHTEELVMDAIGQYAGNKTIILIAHRLHTLKNCERLYLLNNGEIIDQGSYQDISKKIQDMSSLNAISN